MKVLTHLNGISFFDIFHWEKHITILGLLFTEVVLITITKLIGFITSACVIRPNSEHTRLLNHKTYLRFPLDAYIDKVSPRCLTIVFVDVSIHFL